MDENGTKTPTNYNSNGLCNTRIIMDSSGTCFSVSKKIFFTRHYEEQSDVVIQKKSFYVRRTVGLWIATLNTLHTVQSFAMTYLKLSWTIVELVSESP